MYNSLLPGQFCTPGTFSFGHSVVFQHGGRGAFVLADVPTLLTLPLPRVPDTIKRAQGT